MAKTGAAPEGARGRFRGKLSPQQQAAFDELAGLMDAPRTDFAWYHTVGGLVARLLPPEMTGRGRVRWLEGPARVLGRNVSLLQKCLRFHDEYPTEEALGELERMGVAWSQVYLTFVVAGRKERHRLLREAVTEGWTQGQLRFEAQRRHPTRRHGVGGRPRRPLQPLGPEASLREMGRHTQTWLDFHDGAWANVKGVTWKRLIKDWPEEDRGQLRQLLEETINRLDDLLGRGKEVRRTLEELMPGV